MSNLLYLPQTKCKYNEDLEPCIMYCDETYGNKDSCAFYDDKVSRVRRCEFKKFQPGDSMKAYKPKNDLMPDIIPLVKKGLTYKQIANELGVCKQTLYNYGGKIKLAGLAVKGSYGACIRKVFFEKQGHSVDTFKRNAAVRTIDELAILYDVTEISVRSAVYRLNVPYVKRKVGRKLY